LTNSIFSINIIKKTFDEIGLSFIFTNQLEINPNWIKVHAKQMLCDQFVQRWRGDITNSSRGHFISIHLRPFVPFLCKLYVRLYNLHITWHMLWIIVSVASTIFFHTPTSAQRQSKLFTTMCQPNPTSIQRRPNVSLSY
jgi:hypothetical protein